MLLKQSPNEAAKQLEEINRQLRLQRLALVKEEERIRAKIVRTKYQQTLERSLQSANTELQAEWVEYKQAQLQQLYDEWVAHQQQIGVAYNQAEEWQRVRTRYAEQLEMEKERFCAAIQTFRNAKEASQRPQLDRLQHLQGARRLADERARRLARIYQANLAAGVVGAQTEIPERLPIRDLANRNRRQFGDQYQHRDAFAVRCQLDRDLKEQLELNAKEAAALVSDQHRQSQHHRQLRRERNEMEARHRYQHAYHDITMEQTRKELFERLHSLQMKDIQRKQMADERPPLPKTQQDKLAQMFEFEFAGLRNNEDVVVSRVKPVQRFTEDNNDGDNALTFYSPRKHLPL